MSLDERADWFEIADLLTRSYLVLAPAKLAGLVEVPE
jgi:hypothetical protein